MTLQAGMKIPAYGLASNPFALKTLDPLVYQQDLECLSMVDGWKDLTEARDLIGRRVGDNKPVLFVVAGPSSTGRSSVANYLVYLWATAHGVGPASIFVHAYDPGPNSGSYAAEDQITAWTDTLRVRNVTDGLNLTPATDSRLEGLSSSPLSAASYALALRAVEDDLSIPAANSCKRLLAAVLERGKGKDLIRRVKDSFQATRAIVIITIDSSRDSQDVLADVDWVLPPEEGLVLRLSPIQGTDVATVIENRWDCARKGVENPFDLTAAAEVFDAPRSIARVIKLLALMLELRQGAHSGADSWPTARSLAFGPDQMRSWLQTLDRQLNLDWGM